MWTTARPDPSADRRNVSQALQVGAAFQVVCILLPVLDFWIFGSVERHVRTAYPGWSATEVAEDRAAILWYLIAIGILGLVGWLGALWATSRGWHARGTITALFVTGSALAVVNVGAAGDAYTRIVPLWLSLTLLFVPLLPGLTALIAAWRMPARGAA